MKCYLSFKKAFTTYDGPTVFAGKTVIFPPAVFVSFITCLAILFTAPSSLADNLDYYQVTGPCDLDFPADHGVHEGYKTEWWYYTGNVQSPSGDRYGFQLTFFRTQISPPGAEKSWPAPASAWRVQQLYLAHAAVSDITEKTYHDAEEVSRGALGLAGVHQNSSDTTIFLKNWSARLAENRHVLTAHSDDFGLDLTLEELKPPIPHGDSGYSLKGSAPNRASCYYSLTRMKVVGAVTVNGKRIPVQGSAWMDHEFSTAPLEPGLVGWDWFSLQLSDFTEVMIYLLRHQDGTVAAASSGTFVEASGTFTHLSDDMFEIQVLDTWLSSQSKARYPSGWRLMIPSLQLSLTITPNLKDQEMISPETTRVTYWEGSVSLTGSVAAEPVSGVGYVELTGYDKPLEALM